MNIATIGTGPIVDKFLSALHEIDGVKCMAMYSRNEETARPLAERYNVDYIYTDLDAMFNEAKIDIVYIASPNSLHYHHAYHALKYGKHVICEKPFTSTLSEIDCLIKCAKEKGLMLFEAITTIHLPNFKLMRENLNKIGSIKFVQCNYSQYSSRYDLLLKGETPNVFNPDFSGGALMDINVYNLHFVTYLFGPPETVNYTANKQSNGIDTSGVAVLTYPGMIAECVGSKDTQGKNFILVQGEKGYIYVENGPNGCEKVRVCKEEKETLLNAQANENILHYELVEFAEIYKARNFERCYEWLEHSRSVIQILEAARKDAGISFKADRTTTI